MNKNTICAIMLTLLVSILTLANSAGIDKNHEYDDPVINGLLNGESFGNDQEGIRGKSNILNIILLFTGIYFRLSPSEIHFTF